jgi:hypothetical protein
VQVEERQHALDPRRAPDVGRQDHAGELLPHAVDHALIVHPGRRDGQRADAGRHRARAGRAVADDQRVAVLARASRKRATYSAASSCSAAAIIRRAPSRARSSSVALSAGTSPAGASDVLVITFNSSPPSPSRGKPVDGGLPFALPESKEGVRWRLHM